MLVSMRPGTLVRLVAVVAVVSALVIGLLVTGGPVTTSSPTPRVPVVSTQDARAAADVRQVCDGR
jgi:hypothetical protein